MKVLYDTDRQRIAERAVLELGRFIERAAVRSSLTIGLCGGRSPAALLGALGHYLTTLSAPLRSRIQLFQVDERVYKDHNRDLLSELLTQRLLKNGTLVAEQLHWFRTAPYLAPDSVEKAAEDYGEELRLHGGSFSIAVLGVGPDGHIAGCFPHHPSFDSERPYFVSYDESPKPPNGRMTATKALLTKSEVPVLLFLGKDKRDAFERFLDPNTLPRECPCTLFRDNPELLVLTDLFNPS